MILKGIQNVKRPIILSMWNQSFLEFVRAVFCVSFKDTAQCHAHSGQELVWWCWLKVSMVAMGVAID